MIATQAQTKTKFRPPELARQYGVDPAKIIAWIKSGELKAVNIAVSRTGRPRWIIDVADIAAFEAARSSGPEPVITRRRRGARRAVKQYV